MLLDAGADALALVFVDWNGMDVPQTGVVLEHVVAVELVAVDGFVSWCSTFTSIANE
jgi:hypothetical protein